MNRRQIGLGLTLVDIGIPLKTESFQDRLILQKTIYLAQEAGVHLGYYFNWYLHGPYCSALANDAFSVDPESEEFKEWKLDASSHDKLTKLSELMRLEAREALAKKMELLASVHFLIRRKQVSGENSSEIASTLKEYDKHFSEDNVREALGELHEYGLL